MKTRQSPREPVSSSCEGPEGLPDAASLAALRAWYSGQSSREAVTRYLGGRKARGQSSRGILGGIRRQLIEFARQRHREDLATLLDHPATERGERARAVLRAIELLHALPVPEPLIGDDIGRWLPARIAAALQAQGIKTLAALTVRIPRRRRWWTAIPGIGAAGARHVEAFFAAHPQLTERARALVIVNEPNDVVPLERIVVPHEVDGSKGAFRAPRASCTLRADNDYEAVHAWLALH